jgi:homoserine dehydrogenase
MNIALLGLGVVGQGVYDIITNDIEGVTVTYVLELDANKTKGISCAVQSFDTIIEDNTVDCVIELIGGTTVAYQFVIRALRAGKHVITANKALISKYFKELTELATYHNVSLRYEASVGGAINIIDPLNTIKRINKINKVEGIINGSTNFILSKIFLEDYSLEQAIIEATSLGYIETGTTDDMDGLDLLRKINILSMISFEQYVEESSIGIIPLTDLTEEFYSFVKSKNLVIKYIATAMTLDNELSIHLEPVILSENHNYSAINYEDNIISVYGQYHKKQSFIGQGAGRYPTASAVLYDVLKIKEDSYIDTTYNNTYTINNDIEKHRYLILKKDVFIKTEPMTLTDIINNREIHAVARIGVDAYEKI